MVLDKNCFFKDEKAEALWKMKDLTARTIIMGIISDNQLESI